MNVAVLNLSCGNANFAEICVEGDSKAAGKQDSTVLGLNYDPIASFSRYTRELPISITPNFPPIVLQVFNGDCRFDDEQRAILLVGWIVAFIKVEISAALV